VTHKSAYQGLGVVVACLDFGIAWLFPKQSLHGAGSDDFIEDTVASSKGPEAGVWVIAETRDSSTKYSKIVVTESVFSQQSK
jgi:hypothetical protein